MPDESATTPIKVRRVRRKTDMNLGWVEREYPQLSAWRDLAAEWLGGETHGIDQKLLGLVAFSVEIYPDLETGKAVFRRSHLLDAVLYRDGLPPVFMLLGEEEQLRIGNAFIRRLAQQADPTNPALGQRRVIRLMDSGVRLSEHFDIDLSSLLPISPNPEQLMPRHRSLLKAKA